MSRAQLIPVTDEMVSNQQMNQAVLMKFKIVSLRLHKLIMDQLSMSMSKHFLDLARGLIPGGFSSAFILQFRFSGIPAF